MKIQLSALRPWLLALAAPGLSIGSQAQAQPVYGQLAECRAIEAVPARVACYDAIALPPVGAPKAAAAAPLAPAAPVAPMAPAPPVSGFGLPVAPAAAATPKFVESRIAGRFEGWRTGTRVKLANGQVWEVVDTSRATYELDAPTVRIQRGVLGSFFMEVDGVSATPRVRRIE